MKLSNTVYDFLKWFAIAGLHALGVAYNALANIWGLPYGQAIPETLDILGVLLAAFLMWQNYDYNKRFNIVSIATQTEVDNDITDEEAA